MGRTTVLSGTLMERILGPIEFGTVISPVGEPGLSDGAQYAEALGDAEYVRTLGYDALWAIEHHFSDYFPTPSPLLFLSHLAARMPEMDLGTCVIVLPWYNPMRLAGEIAMLSHLTHGRLHLGVGRGTARLEYEALGVPMSEARARFRECFEIVSRGLAGGKFAHHGTFFDLPRDIEIRPRPVIDRINFYGAALSPESSTTMADLNLPMIRVSNFPHKHHAAAFRVWGERMRSLGRSTEMTQPLLLHAVIADTEDAALALAKEHLSRYNAKVVEHYEADSDPWKDIDEYQAFSRFMQNARKLTDPDQMGPWLEFQLVGTAKTVCEQLERYVELGFNHFVVQNATYGMPRAYRHDMWRRFARDVIPHFKGSVSTQKAG